jgi:hypothetical protein
MSEASSVSQTSSTLKHPVLKPEEIKITEPVLSHAQDHAPDNLDQTEKPRSKKARAKLRQATLDLRDLDFGFQSAE